MKLELKYLAPYLPYELKLKSMSNNAIVEMEVLNIYDGYLDNHLKPILRPLSDLTKEVEINGRKSTPIKQLSREGVFFDDTPISTMYDDYREWSVWEYEILISWHFDVFGLIQKGLAIDINTL